MNQREVGEDTNSFSEALRAALREDPDVILVGEMRDLETIQMALTAAETGHLVFGTLHTQDAPQTIDRVIDVFPTDQQEQVRTMLAAALQGVVTQQLIPNADGSGRLAACEVLMCTAAIRNLIRRPRPTRSTRSCRPGPSTACRRWTRVCQSWSRRVASPKRSPSTAAATRTTSATTSPHRSHFMALTFDYKVRDRAGKLVEGSLEGDSMALVVGKLREMGYLPISVVPKTKVNLQTEINIPGLSNRVKLQETAVATRQLATMVDSGLSVVRSLTILAGQVDNKELGPRARRGAPRRRTRLGALAACAKHPKIFNNLFVTMVQAGEAGGSLDKVLLDLANNMEKQAALTRTVKSAMTYPAIVLSVMVIIFLALLIFIVPTFQKLFTQLNAKLPLPTRIILRASHIVLSVWILAVLALFIVSIVLFRRWINTPPGRAAWDRFKLRPPIFGQLVHKVALARFTGTLASLVEAGVPILESLDIVTETSGNQTIGVVLQEAKAGVREGRPLADTLREHEEVIPSLVVQMIEVGEQTGALDHMLRKVAEFYDGEVETTVGNLTQLLEPLLTVVMGAGVGIMVVSMYLPMFAYIKHIPTQ